MLGEEREADTMTCQWEDCGKVFSHLPTLIEHIHNGELYFNLGQRWTFWRHDVRRLCRWRWNICTSAGDVRIPLSGSRDFYSDSFSIISLFDAIDRANQVESHNGGLLEVKFARRGPPVSRTDSTSPALVATPIWR